jgi:GNAT superfamily N-acetyltransferase
MIDVLPVVTKGDRDKFIRFPFRVYATDPFWVPPLIAERREFLDPKKNPFFEFGEVQCFAAFRDGEMVGRIAAIEDRNYNRFQEVRHCGFGLFECFDDQEAADALFASVSRWAEARGLTHVWGPVSFSTNHECGLLVEGFNDRPAIMMTYNPRYYERLVNNAGFAKTHDLWAWELDPKTAVPEKVGRVAEKMREREGIKVRPIDLSRLDTEIPPIELIYHAAWEKNWGFVPTTRAEFAKLVKDLKRIAVPELVLIAEVNNEVAGFSITLPDINQALVKARGKLFPFGFLKILMAARKVERARLTLMGIKAAYRKRGIDAILYKDTLENARRLGYTRGEIGWTLDDNELVNRAIETMGGKRYKTYRMFEKRTAVVQTAPRQALAP